MVYTKWANRVSIYSKFPREKEVLFAPNSTFKVTERFSEEHKRILEKQQDIITLVQVDPVTINQEVRGCCMSVDQRTMPLLRVVCQGAGCTSGAGGGCCPAPLPSEGFNGASHLLRSDLVAIVCPSEKLGFSLSLGRCGPRGRGGVDTCGPHPHRSPPPPRPEGGGGDGVRLGKRPRRVSVA